MVRWHSFLPAAGGTLGCSHLPTPTAAPLYLQLAAQQAAMGVPMTPEAYQQAKVEREMDERNR